MLGYLYSGLKRHLKELNYKKVILKVHDICIKTPFTRILIIIIFSPFAFGVIAISNVLLIRFGTINSRRIGHFAGCTVAYICSRNNKFNYKVLDIIGCPPVNCNHELKNILDENIKIYPFFYLWSFLDLTCQFWTRSNKYHINLQGRYGDYHHIVKDKLNLNFVSGDSKRGSSLLNNLKIPEDEKWVCIHNRDNAYLQKVFPDADYTYHNFRNYSINDMMVAAEFLTDCGYYVVRMGEISDEKISTNNKYIIDYSNSNYKSDFADIYLLSNQNFFLGNDSGIWTIPLINSKIIGMTNFTNLHVFSLITALNIIYIPKKFFDRDKNRFLSLSEIIQRGICYYSSSKEFDSNNIELFNNTSEEILQLSIELNQRYNNEFKQSNEDILLQNKYWNILSENTITCHTNNSHALIGASYLKNNQYMLE
jgi:putative glycosyltransferase (TIGR04372 family)